MPHATCLAPVSGHVSPAVSSLYGAVLGAGLFLTALTLGVVAWIIRSVAHVALTALMLVFSEKREDVEISEKMRSSKIRRKGLHT